jgi:alkanesulfonate monooxygenase SsuD/methylene tetrahydromethanopterin reductase-like flavin-dependent oxidoreductase (luciferase family)
MNGQSATEGMRFGVRLTEQPDVDRMIRQARLADEQGYDSVWLNDHLMPPAPGAPPPGGLPPFDAWTTMTAIGALTRHVRLCWSMLNPFFRQPALLAKMVATLDQITHGRAVLSLGAGWFKLECDAYDLPFLDDHAARIAHEREIVLLCRQLWTHPDPARTTFEGEYVRVRDLPFFPPPYQRPHPPIWLGGDSEATWTLVKEVGDGLFVTRAAATPAVQRLRADCTWTPRPLVVGRTVDVFAAPDAARAREAAAAHYEEHARQAAVASAASGRSSPVVVRLEDAMIGSAAECLARIDELAQQGFNYLILSFADEASQACFARDILPRAVTIEAARRAGAGQS